MGPTSVTQTQFYSCSISRDRFREMKSDDGRTSLPKAQIKKILPSAKHHVNVTVTGWGGKVKPKWTCSLFYHPHTNLGPISLTQTHSVPIPAAGHTSAQDYQISSWRFGSPDSVCMLESELGHLGGAFLWSMQDCFMIVAHENSLIACGIMIPCPHSHYSFSLWPFLLPIPIPDILLILLFKILHIANSSTHTHSPFYVPMIN